MGPTQFFSSALWFIECDVDVAVIGFNANHFDGSAVVTPKEVDAGVLGVACICRFIAKVDCQAASFDIAQSDG